MYAVPIGQMKGTFQATWTDRAGDNEAISNVENLKIELDGASLNVVNDFRIAVHLAPLAGRSRRGRGFGGGAPGPPPVSITLVGRDKRGEQLTVSLMVDRKTYESNKGDPIDVTGRVAAGASRGGFGGRGRGPGRSVRGTLVLKQAGMKKGEPVSGTLDLTIVEARGGFFNRR